MSIFIIFILALLSWQDIKAKSINLVFCILVMVIIVTVNIIFELQSIPLMLSGTGVGVFLLVISVISGNAIGIGDGIVFLITGLTLDGVANFGVLVISLFFSLFVGLYRLIIKKWNRKDEMAFIPYITIGYIVWNIII